MTALTISKATPGRQSGVTINTKLDGYTIKWDPQGEGEKVEIWQHTSNNRDDATKVATVADTYYDSATLTPGTTYYVWTRKVNAFGIPGDWDFGPTSGSSITVVGVTPSSQKCASYTSTSISVTTNNSTTIPSSYNTWTDSKSYVQFSAPSGTAIIAGEMSFICKMINVVHSGVTSVGRLIGKVQVWNNTDGVELPHLSSYHTFGAAQGVYGSQIYFVEQPIFTYRFNVRSGFGDNSLIPGKQYRLRFFLMKERINSDITFDATFLASFNNNSTSDSVTVS